MDVEDVQQVHEILDSICYTPSPVSDDASERNGQPTDTITEANISALLPLSSYDTEIIVDALLYEWEDETTNFRDFMHEISEDLPQRWTRPRRVTQMVQILVCTQACSYTQCH